MTAKSHPTENHTYKTWSRSKFKDSPLRIKQSSVLYTNSVPVFFSFNSKGKTGPSVFLILSQAIIKHDKSLCHNAVMFGKLEIRIIFQSAKSLTWIKRNMLSYLTGLKIFYQKNHQQRKTTAGISRPPWKFFSRPIGFPYHTHASSA